MSRSGRKGYEYLKKATSNKYLGGSQKSAKQAKAFSVDSLPKQPDTSHCSETHFDLATKVQASAIRNFRPTPSYKERSLQRVSGTLGKYAQSFRTV